MKVRCTWAALTLFAALVALPLTAGSPPKDATDSDAIARIKEEGLSAERSRVMEIESYLTDVYGPRLTGSPNISEAADWAERAMNGWGLTNVHRESFSFGRGWQNQRFVATALTPRTYPLIGFPKAWTPGTNGPVTAEAVMAVIDTDEDFDVYRGTLRGKFVLPKPMRAVAAAFGPLGRRYTDGELADLTKPSQPRGDEAYHPDRRRSELERRKSRFWVEEGVAAVIEPSSRGDGGTFFVQAGGSRAPNAPAVAPQVVLAVEHYGRIVRTLEKHIPVTLQLDIDNRFYDADPNAFNLLAEIPGADKPDEVVMIGAHFDSWHAGTGATDNAAGSAVALEAMRILTATGLKLRRTVRIALWSGEEEGLLGSKAYVKDHFGDPSTMQLKPEHARLGAYFNLDNGTGAIRGVYLQGNEAVGPIFARWMAPFRGLGMSTLTIRGTDGTDHLSFDAVGLPAFQFIQDPVEYDTRSHHSNMDVYERVQPPDMMRNAVIVASFLYDAANRDERLPRKSGTTKDTKGTKSTVQN